MREIAAAVSSGQSAAVAGPWLMPVQQRKAEQICLPMIPSAG